jgi:hypothetical protein
MPARSPEWIVWLFYVASNGRRILAPAVTVVAVSSNESLAHKGRGASRGGVFTVRADFMGNGHLHRPPNHHVDRPILVWPSKTFPVGPNGDQETGPIAPAKQTKVVCRFIVEAEETSASRVFHFI